MSEQAVFRIDHFLAMTTVQNLLGSRLANRILEPLWNSAHIAEIEIVWDETLALEGRAGYYDAAGALKDMVQNHLLQVLCLVAMEPPLSLGERDLRDRKIDVLHSIRPLTDQDVLRHTRRARYLAGRIGEREVPAYLDEDGVDPRRRPETFAEVELHLESWRWSGTTFRLRSGKALHEDRKEVAVRFRLVPHLPFGHTGEALPNVLRFGLDPENTTLELTGIGSGARTLTPPHLDRADAGPRTARLRTAAAGCTARQRRPVHPWRRGRRGLARPGPRHGRLVQRSCAASAVPSRIPRTGPRERAAPRERKGPVMGLRVQGAGAVPLAATGLLTGCTGDQRSATRSGATGTAGTTGTVTDMERRYQQTVTAVLPLVVQIMGEEPR